MIGWQNTRRALSELESLLTCKICKRLVSDPCSLEACDHYFCRGCVESQVGVDSKCPECGAFSWLKDLKTNRQLANTVMSCKTLHSLVEHQETLSSIQVQNVESAWNQQNPDVNHVEISWEETQQSVAVGTDSFVFPSPTESSKITETENTSLQDVESSTEHKQSKSEFDFERDVETVSMAKVFKSSIRTYSLKDRKNARKFTRGMSKQANGYNSKSKDEKETSGDQTISENTQSTNFSNNLSIVTEPLDSNDIPTRDCSIENKSLSQKSKSKVKKRQMKLTSYSTEHLRQKGRSNKTASSTVKSLQEQDFTKSEEKRQLRTNRENDKEMPLNFHSSAVNSTEKGVGHCTNSKHRSKKFTKLMSSQHAKSDDSAGCQEEKENHVARTRGKKRKSVESSDQLLHGLTTGKVSDSASPVTDKRRRSVDVKSNRVPASPLITKRNKRGETSVHVAAVKGKIETVGTLLGQGADPNTKDNAGWTPLHEACNHGFVEVAELLLDNGAMIDVAGGFDHDTPLHDAVANGRTEIAKLLVARGAPLDVRNKQGLLPRDYAVTDAMVSILVSHLYSPDKVKTRSGQTVTMSSSTVVNTSYKKKVLLATGLSIEQKQKLQKCVSVAGGEMVNEFTDSVTHIVAAVNKEGVCPRTMKYLNGVLTGKWIVSFDWITKSVRSKCWVDEAAFEVRGTSDASVDAPRKARTNTVKQLPELFDGCNFYLFGDFSPPTPPKDVLIQMIKSGGGKILTREPKPDVSDVHMLYSSPVPSGSNTAPIPSPLTVVYHARPNSGQYTCSQYVLYDSATGKKPRVAHTLSVCSAPVSWLMDCISHFEILDVPTQ